MSKRGKNKTLETAIQPLPGLGGGSGYNPLPKQEGGVEVEKKQIAQSDAQYMQSRGIAPPSQGGAQQIQQSNQPLASL